MVTPHEVYIKVFTRSLLAPGFIRIQIRDPPAQEQGQCRFCARNCTFSQETFPQTLSKETSTGPPTRPPTRLLSHTVMERLDASMPTADDLTARLVWEVEWIDLEWVDVAVDGYLDHVQKLSIAGVVSLGIGGACKEHWPALLIQSSVLVEKEGRREGALIFYISKVSGRGWWEKHQWEDGSQEGLQAEKSPTTR
jgi:hypothetical protein